MDTDKKYTKYIIFFMLAMLIFKVCILMGTYPSGDACWHLSVSKYIGETYTIPTFVNLERDAFSRPPLFHVVSGMFYDFGRFLYLPASNFILQLPNVIFSILSIWLLYLIIKRIYSNRAAFLSAVLFGCLPIVLELGTQAYVETLLTFLVLFTVYLSLKDKKLLSGVALALVLLTNINGFFIVPLIAYIHYYNEKNKNRKDKVVIRKNHSNNGNKKTSQWRPVLCSLAVIALAVILSSPQYIYTYTEFHNPIWPILNSVFHGRTDYSEAIPFQSFTFGEKISSLPREALTVYTELFGLPSGNVDYLSGLGYIKYMFYAWFIATLPILILFIGGSWLIIKWQQKKKSGKSLLNRSTDDNFNLWFFALWIIPSLLLCVFYVFSSTADTHARYFFEALPAIAAVMIIGFLTMLELKFFKRASKSSKKNNTYILIIKILFVAFIAAFLATSVVKTYFNNSTWRGISSDADSVEHIIPQYSNVLTANSCLTYYLHSYSVYPTNNTALSDNKGFLYYTENYASGYTFPDNQLNKVDYIWIDTLSDSKELDNVAESLKTELIYEDNTTNTKVYKIIK